MRRAAKVDDNQSEIVMTFRRMGCTVTPLHAVGGGVPDLLVGCNGINLLVEVKDGKKPPSARKLTKDQEKWHGEWRGQVDIVETMDDAISLVNCVRRSLSTHEASQTR